MSTNTIVGNNYLKFNTSGTSFAQFTKNADNGILDLSSHGSSTVLFRNATDPVDPQDLATRAYVLAQTGSVPGGSTGSIQFNNTTFTGTTEFLYDGIRTITIGSQATTAIIQAPASVSTTSAGGSLSIVSGAGGSVSGNGGDILITAGIATSGTDGTITLNTNGANNLVINNTSVTYLLPTYEQDGSAAAPSYSFANDANTGMYRPAADQIGFSTGGTNHIIIRPDDANKDVGIYTSIKTIGGDTRFHILLQNTAFTAAQGLIGFEDDDAGLIGLIYQTTESTVVYATASDYRLKKDIEDMNSGLQLINNISPKKYKWLKNDSNFSYGFIAHELQEYIPGAVIGTKDAVDENGKNINQMIDYSILTPHLTCAVQELHKMVRNINTKIVTNVGSGNVQLTAEQVMSGIIVGEPSGTRTWTMPAASDIISLIFEPFVGQIISVIFNNESVSKDVIISPGTNMKTRSGIFIIKGHGSGNNISSITLMMTLNNIDSGNESIDLYKG
jgi:hypothetical protein